MSIMSKYVANAALVNRQQIYECECLEFATILHNATDTAATQQQWQGFTKDQIGQKRTLFSFITLSPISQLIRSGLTALL